jgi:hypothetical protein
MCHLRRDSGSRPTSETAPTPDGTPRGLKLQNGPPFGFIERSLSFCEVIITPRPSGHALPLNGDR